MRHYRLSRQNCQYAAHDALLIWDEIQTGLATPHLANSELIDDLLEERPLVAKARPFSFSITNI
ncbi:MAG: hypothetical protein ACE5I9_12540 [Candidatus Methylomirabilales bacterium]